MESAIASGNKKALVAVLEKYPLPIVLDNLHSLLFRAFRDGPNPVGAFSEKYNAKYNIVSEFFLNVLKTGKPKHVSAAIQTYIDTVDKLHSDTSDKFVQKLLKYFTAE
ncbi:unnamed protein product, partial [Phaeothamnion confervicola]